jgi:hypothetical protein
LLAWGELDFSSEPQIRGEAVRSRGLPLPVAVTGKKLIKTIGGILIFVWDLSVLRIGHRGA